MPGGQLSMLTRDDGILVRVEGDVVRGVPSQGHAVSGKSVFAARSGAAEVSDGNVQWVTSILVNLLQVYRLLKQAAFDIIRQIQICEHGHRRRVMTSLY